jgi:hypothetical protein
VGPWQDFLARRYHRIAALNAAYGTSYATFDTVPLPDRLPTGGAALVDWYEFQAIVPAMGWTAHRFTVLLPAPRQPDPDGAEHRRRLELTWRVIQREKPAHATFDIKFYWAYFRVGDVILGDDSVIDQGSRAPELLPPAVLGQSYLAGSYVAPGHPQDVPDRQVVGRDRLGR